MFDITSQHTLDFIKELYPERAPKVLEIESDNLESDAFNSENRFDLVHFKSPLYRMHPLSTVFTKTKKLLDEKGKLLTYELALEEMDERTAEWFYDLRDLMTTVGAIRHYPVSETTRPLERWEAEHRAQPAHHTGKEIIREMERYFGTVHSVKVPYLYRYFTKDSDSTAETSAAQQQIYQWEKRSIERGLIQPMGLRIVSKKYFSYLR